MTQRSDRFDRFPSDVVFMKGNHAIAMAAGGAVIGSIVGFYGAIVGMVLGAVLGVTTPVRPRGHRDDDPRT